MDKLPVGDIPENTTKTVECTLKLTNCPCAQRIKTVLLQYQRIITSLDVTEVSLDTIFNDDLTPATLLDDFHHLIRSHSIDDDALQYESCYEFMTSTTPAISCDMSSCSSMRRYYSRSRGNDDEQYDEEHDERAFVLRQIHCHLLHGKETERLTKTERLEIESKVQGSDGPVDEDEEEELRLKLVSERMRQKTQNIAALLGDETELNSKFVTSTDDVSEEKEESEEKHISLDIGQQPDHSVDEEMKYPEYLERDDAEILHEFCHVTNAVQEVAVTFLRHSEWNLPIALERYFEFNGDLSRIEYLQTSETYS